MNEQLANQRRERDRLEQALRGLAHRVPTIASYILIRGTRSVGQDSERLNRVRISETTQILLFQIPIEDLMAYKAFRATVMTPRHRAVPGLENLAALPTASIRAAVFAVNPKLLTEGDYALSVFGRMPSGGFEAISDLQFTVVRK